LIVAYVLGGILVWAAIAFGLAALFRGTDDRDNAYVVAWVTAFWPVTVPVLAVFALMLGAGAGVVWLLIQGYDGISKVGTKYIDFIHGEKTGVVLPHPSVGDHLPRYGVRQRSYLRTRHPGRTQ
jgi:hypothetical protein